MEAKCILIFKGKRKLCLLFPLFLYVQFVFSQETLQENDSLKQIRLNEVSILGKVSNNVLSGSNGLNIDFNKVIRLPKLMGENDAYKTLQHIGGVTLSSETNAGLYVRGGNNDQNLILLNGALIHNPTHVLGMFSVFNTDVTNQLRFFKYGIPAEYGGKLSSVVDVSTLSNVPEKTNIKGSLGLIMSKIMVQIPLNQKLSVYGSWRGSYISTAVFPLLKLAGIDSVLTRNRYEFWDVNAGFMYKISPKTTLNGSFYKGQDILKVGELKQFNFESNISKWGNTVATIQLNHIFNEEFTMSHRLCFSNFTLHSALDWFNSIQNIESQLKNVVYKSDFIYLYKNNIFKFGMETNINSTQPNFFQTDSLAPFEINQNKNIYHTGLASIYFRDEWTGKKWQINGGIRANFYIHFGPYTDFSQKDTVILYRSSKPIKNYFSLEPRFFARYLISESESVKFSVTRLYQFLNQIPVISFGLPSDIQMPASKNIHPQSSWHFSTGYFRNFDENAWEGSMEIYFKTMENQLNFRNSIANSFSVGAIEKNLMRGKGWAYGTEWKIQKNKGNFTGWLAYNLAWSYRQFDEINKGKPFFDLNDRRHNISLVGMYQLNNSWSFSALFALASGSRLNLPLSWYIIDDKTIFEYGEYNSFTLPIYHRLDVSATCKLKPIYNIKSELNFSIYNVYNRANPFQVYFNKDSQSLKMTYLMPIIPSFSWIFNI